MKRLIEKLKIICGVKTAICAHCKHCSEFKFKDYSKHMCNRYKTIDADYVTGEKNTYLAFCGDHNYNGRCLGFEEVQNKKLLDGVYCVPDGVDIKKEKNIKLKYIDELAPEHVEEFHDWLKGKYSGGKE